MGRRKQWLPARRGPLERNELALTLSDRIPRWVRGWMRQRNINGDSRYRTEDAEADAWVGVLRAAEVWDETRDVPFANYAVFRVKDRLQRGFHRSRLVDRPFDNCDGPEEFSLGGWDSHDSAPSPVDAAERGEVAGAVRGAVGTLPPRQREIVTAYLDGETRLPLARRLGVSSTAVGQRYADARVKLAELLRGVA